MVAVVKEFMVAAVKARKLPGMLDGAPVLLRPGCYLLYIGDQAVEVAAVYAVHLFNGVQVAEAPVVQDDIFPPFHHGYPVYPEADELIQGYHCIHKQRRQEAEPDNRRRQDIEQGRVCQVCMDPGGQGLLVAPGLFVKMDLFTFNLILKFFFLLLDLYNQLFFEFYYLIYNFLQRIHKIIGSPKTYKGFAVQIRLVIFSKCRPYMASSTAMGSAIRFFKKVLSNNFQ